MNRDAERIPEAGPTDDALIAAAQRGDTAAFGTIVRRYQRAVYRVGWALTRNAADADDLAQETFVRAWGAIGRFERGLPLYPWLARITTHLAFSLFRRRKRRPETPIEPLLEAGRQWGVEDDPADHVARSEHDERLRACFAALAPEHQAVLALRVLQDLSYDDLARVLGVPPGTVMSRLSRARAELKQRMREGGPGS
ncbi:MAG TPA: sigma-70 family RNA polymerase sigma factor [Candidatus Acidoferrales bacterium]|nr:sigma-70 family RNA polymerase sigma factor [Candidatus Acidoferrales bacterium]